MSDRLDELKRQRALAQQQLEWFDHEIAREAGNPPVPQAPSAASSAPTPADPTQAAADILARYQRETQGSMARDARRGCLLWFIFALGAFIICTVGAYFVYVELRGPSEGDPPPTVAP